MTESDERSERPTVVAASAEQASATLGDELRARLAEPRLVQAFQTLFAGALQECSLGWPRVVSASRTETWLRDGDIMIEMSQSPAREPFALGVCLAADSAVQLVEALLGGRVDSSLASITGQPSEAECGVLAYAAARLLAASGQPWRVRDVRPCRGGPGGDEDLLVWPLALRHSAGTLQGTLWLARSQCAPAAAYRLAVSLRTQIELAQSTPAVGDEWICEASSLTVTSEGLVGPVSLSVAGCAQTLPAQLRRGHVRVRPGAGLEQPKDVPTTVAELQLGSRMLSLWELAELASGRSIEVDCSGRSEGALHVGDTVARGTLISWRGAVGLRVARVDVLP